LEGYQNLLSEKPVIGGLTHANTTVVIVLMAEILMNAKPLIHPRKHHLSVHLPEVPMHGEEVQSRIT
jgi:hypothetical protein